MQQQYRLRKRRDFQRVFKYGRSVANRHFVVYALKKNGQTSVRVGVSVSKKVAKRAVDRNRVKRLVKEVVRQWVGELAPEYDIVVIARGAAVDLSYGRVEQSLHHVLKKSLLFTRGK